MKKITPKIWSYAINFVVEGFMFNIALAFAIVALVKKDDGMSVWAYVAISLATSWAAQLTAKHVIWARMSREERALYLVIRKHGKNIDEITSKELRSKGQEDIHEILTDVDGGLEIQMIINGTGTFINAFVGVKWILYARKFNKSKTKFNYKPKK